MGICDWRLSRKTYEMRALIYPLNQQKGGCFEIQDTAGIIFLLWMGHWSLLNRIVHVKTKAYVLIIGLLITVLYKETYVITAWIHNFKCFIKVHKWTTSSKIHQFFFHEIHLLCFFLFLLARNFRTWFILFKHTAGMSLNLKKGPKNNIIYQISSAFSFRLLPPFPFLSPQCICLFLQFPASQKNRNVNDITETPIIFGTHLYSGTCQFWPKYEELFTLQSTFIMDISDKRPKLLGPKCGRKWSVPLFIYLKQACLPVEGPHPTCL